MTRHPFMLLLAAYRAARRNNRRSMMRGEITATRMRHKADRLQIAFARRWNFILRNAA